MFDILKAKESFMNYVRQFDLTNDKIHLKLVHTLEVVRTTEYLCLYENITGVERDLAYLIALLHDHSLYKIPNNLEPSLLKQVLLIRDSDKLDNFRVKNIESIQTLFSISDADFYSQRVSQNILKDIENHTLILKENRHNEVDMWVSYMAFVFDLNFKSSYLFIRENDYIHRNMERLHFTGDLKEDMLFVEKTCQSYVEEKCM